MPPRNRCRNISRLCYDDPIVASCPLHMRRSGMCVWIYADDSSKFMVRQNVLASSQLNVPSSMLVVVAAGPRMTRRRYSSTGLAPDGLACKYTRLGGIASSSLCVYSQRAQCFQVVTVTELAIRVHVATHILVPPRATATLRIRPWYCLGPHQLRVSSLIEANCTLVMHEALSSLPHLNNHRR